MRRSFLRFFLLLPLLTGLARAEPALCPRQDCQGHGGHDALLHIMQQCMSELGQGGLQCPCQAADAARGYVLSKDCKGASQFLLLPSGVITGIEDPALLAPDAPNYFALAWRQRARVGQELGRSLPDDALSLAVNPQNHRSQNQLHIHIDCIDPEVRAALATVAGSLGPRWQTVPGQLKGSVYRARLLPGSELEANPFALLFGDLQQRLGKDAAQADMGHHSLLLAGVRTAAGPALLLLDGVDTAAEALQDHDCQTR